MLFYLTNSLIVEDAESPELKLVYNSCRNLLESAFNCRHMVVGDIEVLEWLDRIVSDTDIVKGVVKKLLNDAGMSNTIPPVTEYVEVVRGIAEGYRHEENRDIYLLDFSRFRDAASLAKSVLIGEDLNDAKMFHEIGKWLVVEKSYNLSLISEYRAGAGSNICRVVQEHQNEGKIFACIVDTDQRYPGGPYGNTYSRCATLTFTAPFETFKPINAHEVENLFPKNLIESLGYTDGQLKNYRSIYANLEPQEDIRYFDMKSGFTKHKTYSLDPAWVAFNERCYNANEHVNSIPLHPLFENAGEKHMFYPGIDGSILEKSVTWMHSSYPNYPEFDFLDFQREEWDAIGQIVLNKCICRSNEALNY